MASNWRSLAATILAEEQPPERGAALPPAIVAGLESMRGLPPPRLSNQSTWHEVRRDAEWLAASGWAGKALALGWDPLAVFGCGQQGSRQYEGLAVWLAGRRLVLLDEHSAIAVEGRARSVFHVPRTPARAVFLWAFGRQSEVS